MEVYSATAPNCTTVVGADSVYMAHCNETYVLNQFMWQDFRINILTVSILCSALTSFPYQFTSHNLKTLTVTQNDIRTLNTNANQYGLEILDLSHNNISYIEAGFVTQFIYLRHLNLSHNKLKSIDSEFYYKLLEIRWDTRYPTMPMNVLDLSHNEIDRGTHLKNIEDYFPFPDAVTEYNQCQIILNSNRISRISDLIFGWKVPRKDTVKFHFSHDKKYIDMTSVLEGNPVELDCWDALFYRNMTKQQIDNLSTSQISSKYFNYSVEFDVSQNEFEDMHCMNISQDCPKNCVCNVHGISLIYELECVDIHTLPAHLPMTRAYATYFILVYNSSNIRVLNTTYLSKTEALGFYNSSIEYVDPEALESIAVNTKWLDLKEANLTTLSPTYIWPKLERKHLSLSGNQWHCDCNIHWMKNWIITYAEEEQKEIICASPWYNAGHQLSILPDYRFICTSTILITLLFGAVIIFCTMMYRWRFWMYQKYAFHPFEKDECEGEDKKFDVFVSYSNDDYEWARELMTQLQQHDYRVCCHEGDFLPGTTISENVERAVHYSKRTLCIISKAFMESNVCMHEFKTARSFDYSCNKNRLLVIMCDDIAEKDLHEDLRMYVKKFTYLKKDSMFMQRLLDLLPQNRLGGGDEDRPTLIDDYRDQTRN